MLTYLYRKVGFILNSLFEESARYSIFRAAILCVIGIVTFFFPDFLLSGMVYVIAGYGLYDETSDSPLPPKKNIAKECLDIWNLIFEKQIRPIISLSQN